MRTHPFRIEPDKVLKLARQVIETEAAAVSTLAQRLDQNFIAAVELLFGCAGKAVVSGMGKSGHIARKLAATLASTGTPAFFVHPAEAGHGDLGMISAHDVVIVLSNSGETEELLNIIPLVKRIGASLIAITGRSESNLSRLADVHLDARVDKEACPLNLAPTASTTAALALGDALAVAIFDARGFSAEDFARSHPGGTLGRRLLIYVRDVMRTSPQLPRVNQHATVFEALFEMTEKRLGMTAIVDDTGQIQGIFTDGDLRRTLEKHDNLKNVLIRDVMAHKPHTIRADQLAVEAVEQMELYRINQLLVEDDKGALIGALNMHDLFNAKVV